MSASRAYRLARHRRSQVNREKLMYSRHYPPRHPLHHAPQRNRAQEAVPRELAVKIAQERDLLYEELQRLQQAHKESQLVQQRRETQWREDHDALLARTRRQQRQIEALEGELERAIEQREAAEYTSQLLSSLSATSHDTDSTQQQEAPVEEVYAEVLDETSSPSPQQGRDEALILSMLTLRDSLERASSMTTDPNNPWKQGLDHMISQFDETLAGHGWEGVAQSGEAFNPEVHEAIGTAHTDDLTRHNLIQEVVRQGFAHAEEARLARPAQVIVLRANTDD